LLALGIVSAVCFSYDPIRVAYAQDGLFEELFFLVGIRVLFLFMADLKVLLPERIQYSGKGEIVIRMSISERGLSWRWRGIRGVRMLRYA
jgi:hypothetical protein